MHCSLFSMLEVGKAYNQVGIMNVLLKEWWWWCWIKGEKRRENFQYLVLFVYKLSPSCSVHDNKKIYGKLSTAQSC